MGEAIHNPICSITVESRDFNQLAEFYADWGADYQQITPGAFKGSLNMAAMPTFSIFNDVWSESILVRGSIPKGVRVFAATTTLDVPQRYKGTVLEEGELITVADGMDIDYQTLGAFDGLSVSLPEETVSTYLAVTGRSADWAGKRESIIPKQTSDAALATGRRWKEILAILMDPPDRGVQALENLGTWAQNEILDSITADCTRLQPESSRRKRLAIADRARAYLEMNCNRPVTLAELCSGIEGNERTLLLGFNELMGCSPGAYHRAIRYNLARRELLEATGGTTVTDIAVRWGFYHFGRFSTGYRKQFGKTPSETLRRGLHVH